MPGRLDGFSELTTMSQHNLTIDLFSVYLPNKCGLHPTGAEHEQNDSMPGNSFSRGPLLTDKLFVRAVTAALCFGSRNNCGASHRL